MSTDIKWNPGKILNTPKTTPKSNFLKKLQFLSWVIVIYKFQYSIIPLILVQHCDDNGAVPKPVSVFWY